MIIGELLLLEDVGSPIRLGSCSDQIWKYDSQVAQVSNIYIKLTATCFRGLRIKMNSI